MSDLTVLGMVGLGTMGSAITKRLLDHGHKVAVFDLNADAVATMQRLGAVPTQSLSELSRFADAVFLSLPTPEVVQSVCLGEGGLHESSRAKTVIDLSTTGRHVVESVAAALGKNGITLIDCPVSGGESGAVAGTLALIAAGEHTTIESLEPAFRSFGRLFIIGDTPGQAQTLKVINNMVSVTSLAMTSEAMVLGAKAGLDPDVMIDVLNASSGKTSASAEKVPEHILPRTFDFGMTVGLSCKDIRLCMEESDRHGVPMMVGNAARTLLQITRDQFGSDVDMTNIIRVIEHWAHVEVAGKAATKESTG